MTKNFPIKANTLKGHALREYKKTITLNAIQKEVLIGTLLGDASIPFRKGKSVLCVQFKQTHSNAEYIHHLYDLFEHFVGTPPRVEKIRDMRGGQAKYYQSILFRTYGHPEFQFYDDLFYPVHGALRALKVRAEKNEFLQISTNY